MISGSAYTYFYFFYKNAKINLAGKKLGRIFAGGLVGGYFVMIWGGADTQFYFFYKNVKINLVDKKLGRIFATD